MDRDRRAQGRAGAVVMNDGEQNLPPLIPVWLAWLLRWVLPS